MKAIYLFSNYYPYGMVAESFLMDELQVVSQMPCCYVEVIPLHKNEFRRDLPSNIVLNTKLSDTSLLQKMKAFFSMILGRFFWLIPFQRKYSPKSRSDYFQAIKYLYGSYLIRDFLFRNKDDFKEGAIFYSYWFNHTPLGFCMAKEMCRNFEKSKIYTRAHGFDVYEDSVGTYFPFRNKVLSMIDRVFVVSGKGVSCLKQRYPIFSEKIDVSRLGVFPHHVKQDVEKCWDISILSCSSVVPIKRVDLIFDSINRFCQVYGHLKVKWTHIGGGKGFDTLQKGIKSKECNLTIDLAGSVDKPEVMEIYKRGYFNLFVNLSLSEGIPVAIMEAISWGIPVLATDVGGNKEIVTEDTGLLLAVDFVQKQFNDSVLTLMENREALSKSTFEFYLKNYNAEINYTNFYMNQLK